MSSRELAEWQAYWQIEPWGESRADLRSGIVASVMANVHRDAKTRRQPYTPRDFMPRLDEAPREPQTWQDMLKQVEMINAAWGGEDNRNGRTK